MDLTHDSSLPAVASGLSPSPNRAYLATCLRHSAQIPRSARNFRYAQPLYAITMSFIENCEG